MGKLHRLDRLTGLVPLLAAFAGFALPAQAADIKVGFPMILSGAGAQFGGPILQGAQMYVDEVNKAGGVLGNKIVLVPRDTKSRPDEAVRVSRELLDREEVNFLVGSFTSGEGPAVSEIAQEYKTVFLALGPKTDRLTAPDKLHPYVFRISANTTTEGRAAAAVVAKWPVKRVATMAPDFAYGRDASASFVARLKQLRPDIEIVDQQWPRLNETDYAPFITAQLGAKPEAVFSVICCGNFDSFAKQAKPLGYFEALKNNFIGVAEAGSIETQRSLAADYPVGVWGNAYDAFYWKSPDPAIAAEHDKYIAKLKAHLKDEYPPSWSIQGYIGMQFLVAAIEKAKSVKSDDVSKALRGLAITTPQGPMMIRAKDQQATRGMLWGKSAASKEFGFPILAEVLYIDPAEFMD
jgi:branched-chain amino acid transport system substrate-binding protein